MDMFYLHIGCDIGCEALVMGIVLIDCSVLHKNASQLLCMRWGTCHGDCKRGVQRSSQQWKSVIGHAVRHLVQELQACLQTPSILCKHGADVGGDYEMNGKMKRQEKSKGCS